MNVRSIIRRDYGGQRPVKEGRAKYIDVRNQQLEWESGKSSGARSDLVDRSKNSLGRCRRIEVRGKAVAG
jgi:hypothetical protein